jgi:hypothetical protein
MYGHVTAYLDAEAQRLRADREKSLAQTWRIVAAISGLLALAFLAMLTMAETRLASLREFSQQAADDANRYRQRAADAANDFERCKSANGGLVESLLDFDRTIKDQKLLIDDALDLAKRCDVLPAQWVVTDAR